MCVWGEENVEILFLVLLGSFVSSPTLLVVVLASLPAHGGVDLSRSGTRRTPADGTMTAYWVTGDDHKLSFGWNGPA